MTTFTSVRVRLSRNWRRLALCTGGAFVLASLAVVSAHNVKGLQSPTLARAFVSSPSVGGDPSIPIAWGTGLATVDTGLRVICFYVANPSPERLDRPGWPRVTGVGLELPGAPAGFALLSPLDGNWELSEGVRASMFDEGRVTLDFAIRARVNPTGRTPGRPHQPLGVPPGQPDLTRGIGTRFCVSGPFPEVVPNLATPDDESDTIPATVEALLNGVVVGFHGVDDGDDGTDAGVWTPTPPLTRPVPMYP